MNITNPFAAAAKMKLRFETSTGHLTVENLFELSLKDLDRTGRAIRARIRERDDDSLLENPDRKESAAQKEDELRFEIIKAVIDIKQTENRERKAAADKKTRREFLERLLEKKKLDQLEGMEMSEIEKQLAALDEEDAVETGAEEPAQA